MFPPIYPIALLLSKLVPYDFSHDQALKVQSEKINLFYEKLLNLTKIKNYHGRVMISKAITPFKPLSSIPY